MGRKNDIYEGFKKAVFDYLKKEKTDEFTLQKNCRVWDFIVLETDIKRNEVERARRQATTLVKSGHFYKYIEGRTAIYRTLENEKTRATEFRRNVSGFQKSCK